MKGRRRSPGLRALRDRAFVALCLAATSISVVVLAVLLIAIFVQGKDYLSWAFLNNFPSRRPAEAGFKAALWGSVWLCAVCAVIALPLGIATAIFLEEYKPRGRWLGRFHAFVQLNITNLAGVPSIVYGIIALTAFVRMFGLFGSPNLNAYDDMLRVRLAGGEVLVGDLVEDRDDALVLATPVRGEVTIPAGDVRRRETIFVREHVFTLAGGRTVRGSIREHGGGEITLGLGTGEEITFPGSDVLRHATRNAVQLGNPDTPFYIRLPLGSSVLAGALTLTLVILPIVIIASVEALRAVPDSLREGAFACGATRWQMVRTMILPAAAPGIMTGAILAMSRAIGEAAPLLVIGGFLYIAFTPRNLMDDFAAMPLQIFNWAGRPQEEFHKVAAAGIIVLLAVLLAFNAVAIVIRQRFQKPLQ